MRRLGTGVCLLLALAAPASALPKVRVCLKVDAPPSQQNFQKLVENQLAHYPTHQLVSDGCETLLTVELYAVGKDRYLTARVNQEVPVRYDVSKVGELNARVADALRRVLGQDPAHLGRDITRYNALKRALHSVIKRGRNSYRIELLQTIMGSGHNALFASGGAFTLSRGSGHYHVFARLYGLGSFDNPSGTSRALRLQAGADLGVTYEFFDTELTSPFVSVGLGAQVNLVAADKEAIGGQSDSALVTRGVLSVRLGWRFFRAHDYSLGVFVGGHLPFGKLRDPDAPKVIDTYAPSMHFGIGVGF